MSPDELLTPPVFNYSRPWQWMPTAAAIFVVFKVASNMAQSRISFAPQQSTWVPVGERRVLCTAIGRQMFSQEWLSLHALRSYYNGDSRSSGNRGVSHSYDTRWMSISELLHLRRYIDFNLDDAPDDHHSRTLLRIFFQAIIALCTFYSGIVALVVKDRQTVGHRKLYLGGPGGGVAYAVMIETSAQATMLKAAWIGALVLACTSASAFLGLVNLLLHTQL
ncbi:hypothetical protein EDB19DRAFT_2042348 [Suillus lakei]|nr:hypothetical protein EDB19DRAFT_2042348 [Suillus lakei]